MKKLILCLLLTSSSNIWSYAIEGYSECLSSHSVDAVACGFATTTSLPTMIVMGSEVDLGSEAAMSALVTEVASGAEETPMLDYVATKLETDNQIVSEIVLELMSSDLAITIDAIEAGLQ